TGRHANVDDGDIRSFRSDEGQERRRVTCFSDDVEARLHEEPREPLTDEDRVVGDYDAHGIVAVTVVPSSGVLSTSRLPSTAARRSESPARPEPGPTEAPPTPSSVTSITSLCWRRATLTTTDEACAYLATFVSASETKK